MSQKGLFIIRDNIATKNSHSLQKSENMKQITQSFNHGKKVFQNSELSKISLELLKHKMETHNILNN
jgi:hypothetical protein